MWIGNLFTSTLVAISLLSISGCHDRSNNQSYSNIKTHSSVNKTPEASAAWWYTFTPTLHSTTLLATPVQTYSPDWIYAELLTNAFVNSQVSDADLEKNSYQEFSYSVNIDLDHDGVAETVATGVYETASGKQGRFIVITHDDTLLHSFIDSSEGTFSILYPNGDNLRWYKCLECGEYETLAWSNGHYYLE